MAPLHNNAMAIRTSVKQRNRASNLFSNRYTSLSAISRAAGLPVVSVEEKHDG